MICGFFKLGNLLQIMKRLGNMACTDKNKTNGVCPEGSVFQIGTEAPPWAANSAPYKRLPPWESIWVPAHDPNDPRQSGLARRDEFIFVNLYKMYQLVLVDTSKLVTGNIPVTISK